MAKCPVSTVVYPAPIPESLQVFKSFLPSKVINEVTIIIVGENRALVNFDCIMRNNFLRTVPCGNAQYSRFDDRVPFGTSFHLLRLSR